MFEFAWETYALLGAGLFFVVLEVMFPSGGLLGIGSALCLFGGGYFAFQSGGTSTVLGYAVLVALLAPATVLGSFKILPLTPMGKNVILSGTQFADRKATEEGLESLVGQSGTTLTALRPAGIARIGERRVDVVTRGGLLEAGDPVRVVRVEGNRVVVERVS